MPTKKKKKQNRQKKSERKELEEKKGKVKFEEVTLTVKPKIKTIKLLIFWNLFSAHAWTSEADIYYQEQKATKRSTCKQRFGQFWFVLVGQLRAKSQAFFWQNFVIASGLILLTLLIL